MGHNMNDENSKTLTEKFPKLYKGESCGNDVFGFECGDGWFKLIYDLSEKIETIINALPKEHQANICASQVKEKFGSLRFYMSSETNEISDLISDAEHKSYEVCETCSEPSIILGDGWIVNQCRGCYIKYVAGLGTKQNAIDAGSFWTTQRKSRDNKAKAIARLNNMRESRR